MNEAFNIIFYILDGIVVLYLIGYFIVAVFTIIGYFITPTATLPYLLYALVVNFFQVPQILWMFFKDRSKNKEG